MHKMKKKKQANSDSYSMKFPKQYNNNIKGDVQTYKKFHIRLFRNSYDDFLCLHERDCLDEIEITMLTFLNHI